MDENEIEQVIALCVLREYILSHTRGDEQTRLLRALHYLSPERQIELAQMLIQLTKQQREAREQAGK